MAFPSASLQTAGNTHTVGELSWSFNGYAWDKVPSTAGVAGVCQDLVNLGVLVTGGITVGINPDVAIKIAGISLGDPIYGGVTFADDTFQSTAVNPTAIVHVAGISADGGITAGGNITGVDGSFGNTVYANRFYGSLNTTTGMHLNAGSNTLYLKANNVSVAKITPTHFNILYPLNVVGISLGDPIYGGVTFADDTFQSTAVNTTSAIAVAGVSSTELVTGIKGISLGDPIYGGVTFADDTFQSTAPQLSYTGHIEAPIVKQYTLDPYVASARTITGYFVVSTAGTATAILKHTPSGGSDATIKSASVTDSSGVQTSLGNTLVAANSRLWLDVTAIDGPENVSFSVSYTE